MKKWQKNRNYRKIHNESGEVVDHIITVSLYCGQMGRCYVTKQPLELGHMHCHHRIPRHFGGDDKYENLVLVTDEVHRLLHATRLDTIAHYMLKLKPDSKQLRTLNRLRRWLQLPEFQPYTSCKERL